MVKVFADYIEGHKDFDNQASFSIERVGGIKLLRKYRKAQLINEFIKRKLLAMWPVRVARSPHLDMLPQVVRAGAWRQRPYDEDVLKY